MPSSSILPVTYPPPSSSYPSFELFAASSFMPPSTTSAALDHTIFIKQENGPAVTLRISSTFEDEKIVPSSPLLSRTLSFTSSPAATVNNSYQHRRDRTASENSLSSLSSSDGRHSLNHEDDHMDNDRNLFTRVGLELLRCIRVGFRWIARFLALYCYSILLFPGFVPEALFMVTNKGIGENLFFLLDLYLPKNVDEPNPVVAFVTGGAWIIGIYLMGQSAGAHIAACTLVGQVIKEAGGESISWGASQITTYFGLSGGYNLYTLVDYFHSRGLYRSFFLRIMEGEESLQRFFPVVLVQDPNFKNAASLLPPIILFHGTTDYSIPSEASTSFAETLQRVGVTAEAVLYEGKTHTDVFLQDPMRGGRDQMFEDIISIIHANDADALAKDAVAPPRKRLVLEFMLELARKVSPF